MTSLVTEARKNGTDNKFDDVMCDGCKLKCQHGRNDVLDDVKCDRGKLKRQHNRDDMQIDDAMPGVLTIPTVRDYS